MAGAAHQVLGVVVALFVERLDADAHQVALPDAGADGVDDSGEGLLGVGAGDAHELDLVHGLDHAGVVHDGLGVHHLDAALLEGLGVDVGERGAVDAQRLLLHAVLHHEVEDLVDHPLHDGVVGSEGRDLGDAGGSVDAPLHPRHTLDQAFLIVAPDDVRLAVAGAEANWASSGRLGVVM